MTTMALGIALERTILIHPKIPFNSPYFVANMEIDKDEYTSYPDFAW